MLVAAARSDPAAFKLLYTRYLNPIYRYCYVRLGSHHAAEDATSEVFLKVFANLHTFRGGVFAGWLYRIAHNVVIDMQRLDKRKSSIPMDMAGEPIDPVAHPEALAIAGAERAALVAALQQLPDEQRAAVELQLAGWSGEQIGAALGRSPGAVRMLRVRALDRLRELLSEPDPTASAQGGQHARA